MNMRSHNQVGGAVFLIGLGVIAFFNYWWPGIMFVIGASLLASEWVETNGAINFRSGRVTGAGVMILIGLVGVVNINWGALWPIILIALGASMLFGRGALPSRSPSADYEDEKPKRKTVTIDEEEE